MGGMEHIYQKLLKRIARTAGAQAAQWWQDGQLLAEVGETAGSDQAWHCAPVTRPEAPSGELKLAPATTTELGSHWAQLAADNLAVQLSLMQQRDRWEITRAASVDMLAINEEEFGRIILDIHDGPVQNMFAALSQVNLIQTQLAHGAVLTEEDHQELQKRLPRISLLLESSLTEIRNFISTFRPPEFARRSLPAVVEGLIIQHEELTGDTVDLEVVGMLPTVPLPVKIAIYRIIQEALFNAHKHAGVNQQFVRLHLKDGVLNLLVADQGAGFDPATLATQIGHEERHIGLRGMRDRVSMLGGTFELQSALGKGTRVVVQIPLG